MNQGKIWLVVKPTVGLPALLGSVALIALAVHAAVLTKTDWYPAYLNGNLKAKAAPAASIQAPPSVAASSDEGTTVALAPAAKDPPGKAK
jgi:light-harvesting protein B-800-850 alpha chain